MNIIEYLKKLFTNNKKNAQIITQKLVKKYGTKDKLEIALYENHTPLVDRDVRFNINTVDYIRKTDENGIARLNINLNPGEYLCLVSFEDDEYNYTSNYAEVDVNVDTRMEGTDITKNVSDSAVYQCAVYDMKDNQRLTGATVDILVNGVNYTRITNNDGLAKLNINLDEGKYELVAKFRGNRIYNSSTVTNSIVVNSDPAPPTPEPEPTPTECENPYESSPHPTAHGCNGMGQNNSFCCGPSAIHKALYKFGIRDISQGTLSSWAGTTSAGTGHDGLETAIAKVNKVKGTNIQIDWYNLSDLDWETIGKIICQPNKALFCHILYKNGGTCDGSGNFGHYELLTRVNTETEYVEVLNSLGGYCGDCYCGYYQDRTIACQEQFIRGISQKSIAVLTMK